MKMFSSCCIRFRRYLDEIRRRKIYNLQNWKRLSLKDQRKYYQGINPYTDWTLFKEIEKDFSYTFGKQPGIDNVFCGNAGTLGPFWAICVKIKRNSKRVSLPKEYLGFPVLRFYQRRNSN